MTKEIRDSATPLAQMTSAGKQDQRQPNPLVQLNMPAQQIGTDRQAEVIQLSKAFIENQVLPVLDREPRLRTSPQDYTHAVKFPGKHQVDGESAINLAKETLSKRREVSLYVHIPTCSYKCTFCHYPVVVSNHQEEIDGWVDTIIKESELYQRRIPEIRDCRVTSFYVGGGTPTLLDQRALERLITHFRENYNFDKDLEITIEGTPDSCTHEKINFLSDLGVNRVSVGVQTLNNSLLGSVNRQHDADRALECIDALVASRIRTVNCDLIYGFADQSAQSFLSDLDRVLSYGPTSVTVYRVRLGRSDEGPSAMLRLFEKDPTKFPSIEIVYTMQHAARNLAGLYGYHEEPSGWFSQPGSRVQVYKDRWIDQKPMIGFGWQAYSYSKGWEYHNFKERGRYLTNLNSGKLPLEFGYAYDEDERQRRLIAFRLKSQFQLSEDEFRARFGQGSVWASAVGSLRAIGLLEKNSPNLNSVGKVLVEEFVEKFLIKK